MKNLVLKLLNQSYLNQKKLASLKREWAKKNGSTPKNSQIFLAYQKLIKQKKVRRSKNLENVLRLKKIRSLSGIVPIAVLTKPYPCPGKCVYCPTQKGMPKSYLDDEPAAMRAKMAKFDPYLQVHRRLKQLQITGHSTQKIELIVMGGTSSVLPASYQRNFIANCFMAANNYPKNNLTAPKTTSLSQLKYLQKINETAKNRIIGITLETRPDEINIKEIKFMRQLGATRVEIGIQSTFDEVLKKNKRGHSVSASIKATKLLKDAGFKICYHLMPNLPASNLKKDYQMFEEVFNNPDFKPDMIKIYPCVVCYQAELYQWFKQGKFKPYSDKDLIKLLVKIKTIIPQWIRINRLGRDIPINNIAAGNKISNIRQVVQRELVKQNLHCQCIRCREIRNSSSLNNQTVHFSQLKYKASGGDEYFLQYIDNNQRLYGLLRLRIPSQIFSRKKHFLPALQDSAIIRELHIYGLALSLKTKNKKATQHHGFGKKLIKRAEKITQSLGIKKIAVISGVGVRDYYRRLGYHLQGSYLVKNLA